MIRSRLFATIALVVSACALTTSAMVIATAGPDRVDNVGSRAQLSSPVPAQTSAPSQAQSSESALRAPRKAKYPSQRVDATKPIVREKVPSPTRIMIPAIGVDAPIDAIGVDEQGRVAVPRDVTRIGWYKWGPSPGASIGSAVVTGHVDGVEQGPGEFYDLRLLEVEDRVRIERADGSVIVYRVIARESFDKSQVPLEDLFSRSGPHRLTLVTCGGPFDYESLVYTDNVVVTAVPV